jgi:hypothetical protein
MRTVFVAVFSFDVLCASLAAAERPLALTTTAYEDRVRGAWIGQIIGTLLGFQFEGRVASTPLALIDRYPRTIQFAQVDDDYFYEMVALRGFEKYGIDMTLDELGEEWKANAAGSWGSSEQTRLALSRGIKGSEAGHPRNNRLWWTIGPQFSADIYGMLAPGDPNLAGRLARKYGHINGYAEGADGGVFVAGMVSLAFRENDPRKIVREAARLIHPSSPYRQCLDMVIAMGEQGKPADEVFRAVEDRWHIEYPPMNNAVANGGLVAASVWFGEGDYLRTLNLAYRAADYSDADCNAANAGAVVGAMHGSRALPQHLVEPLNDRIAGTSMGPVVFPAPIDERISEIVRRITVVGREILAATGATVTNDSILVPHKPVQTQPAERFSLSDYTGYWNPEWILDRAGFGGISGPGINGPQCPRSTFLDGDVLVTYPRDEVRGLLLKRTLTLSASPLLEFEIAADRGCAWQLDAFVNNTRVAGKQIEGGETAGRAWQKLAIDLTEFGGKRAEIRIYQRTVLPKNVAGSAYWRNLRVR